MTATTVSSRGDLRSLLATVREYAELLDVYHTYNRRGRLPPPTLRARFKCVEGALQEPGLPLALAKYVHRLHTHPRHPTCRTTTTVDRKNRCRVCLTPVHVEWLASVADCQVAYLCTCGALFTPTVS